MPTRHSSKTVPERFRVSARTLLLDRLMTVLIMIGGVSIIVAVFFIFVFIAFKTFPLFRGAEVEAVAGIQIEKEDVLFFGLDEWRELPYFVLADGRIGFLDLNDGSEGQVNRGTFEQDVGLPADFGISFVGHNSITDEVFLGSKDGRFMKYQPVYRPTYPQDTGRVIDVSLNIGQIWEAGRRGHPVVRFAHAGGETRQLAAVLQDVNGEMELHAIRFEQRRGLFGAGELQVRSRHDLTPLLRHEPQEVLVPADADNIVVIYTNGEVDFLVLEQNEFNRRQTFAPFADTGSPWISMAHYIFGDVTILLANSEGKLVAWSIYFDHDTSTRLYHHSKTFEPLPVEPSLYAGSRRHKIFLLVADRAASLQFMTTERIRWQEELPFRPRNAMIAPRYDAIAFLDEDNHIHIYSVSDEHPVAGMRSFFTRIIYEGRQDRIFDWQSSGPADFEQKLSIVPLLIGTMKGTIYAMLLAVPIALLSALYVSQFLRPELKRVVKPTMEIMASLPSVVLGFFAALWLSPLISNAVPSVMLAIMGMFVGALITGFAWTRLPTSVRLRLPSGWEFLFVAFPAFAMAGIGWWCGQIVENWAFLQYDETLGRDVGSFRLWVVNVLGMDFETRNALVVGFAMGFAVIPIIFTITEDSLSNVPNAFRSGSLALGASRWQTAMRIVLPTASAGIFSALMIGFGRAVGETMIMVMATGNAVVQDFNPFTGMRTLSANIAVELSEAEQNGTLYRTLFLCAVILFMFTFTLNTFAELLRQWLRKRYRAVE